LDQEAFMNRLQGETGLPFALHARGGFREFALPVSEVGDSGFGKGARVIVTTVGALLVVCFASAMCSIAFAF
jgi:hypothetical protein